MIYLDNAATTKPSKAAVDAMIKAAECFGNPSSLHGLGIEAEKLINESKKSVQKLLRAKLNIHLYLRHSENLKLTDLMLSILTLTVRAE